MAKTSQEERLQAVARRHGLKLVLDRYRAASTGINRYFLRPIWDARHAVRVRPAGGYELVKITEKGRRKAASLLPLDKIEIILTGWDEASQDPSVKKAGNHAHQEENLQEIFAPQACRAPSGAKQRHPSLFRETQRPWVDDAG